MNAVAMAIASEDTCPHCGSTLLVPHPRLGVIRCIRCTTREPAKDPDAFRQMREREVRFQLTGAEKRRIERSAQRIIALTLSKDLLRLARVDREFVATDRVMQRWGREEGTGFAAANPDVYSEVQPPPLDPKTQEIVSDVVKSSPPGIRTFTDDWYSSHIPVRVIAAGDYWRTYSRHVHEYRPARALDDRGVLREWHAVLRYLRFRFERSRHQDLIVLVRALP